MAGDYILNFISSYQLGDLASIAGLFVSILGFILTIANVRKSKKAAELAEIAVKSVRHDLRLYQTVNAFANAISAMDDIKKAHRQNEWILLPDRYNSIRKALISIRFENPVLCEEDQKDIQTAITLFAGLEKLVDKHLQLKSSDDEIDVSSINSRVSKQIDKIQELLVKLKGKVGGNK